VSGSLRGSALAFVLLVGGPATSIVAAAVVSPAVAEAHGPRITITPASAAPGDRVTAVLDGWPPGAVTVAVCGNAARRGSQDCDQIAAETVPIRDGSAQLRIPVVVPPVGCPCVVQASTSVADVVRAAPIDITGVPGGVDIAPATSVPDASAIAVSARVTATSRSFLDTVLPTLGGTSHKTLVLSLQNRGPVALTGLRVVGELGRGRRSGAPISKRVPGPIAPGTRTSVSIPIVLATPAYGSYVVSGSVYGLSVPVRFRTTTSNDPWGIEVAAIVLLVVLAQVARRRERRARAAARMVVRPTPMPTTVAGAQSSPDVGVSYRECCDDDSYDRPCHEHPRDVVHAPRGRSLEPAAAVVVETGVRAS
jgi:hypothetical protein